MTTRPVPYSSYYTYMQTEKQRTDSTYATNHR